MRDDKTHYVYVISKVEDNKLTCPVKVGISADPHIRLATLQTACPFPIKIAYVFEAPNRDIARHIERSFHATQANCCLHGEWFDHHPIAAIHLLCLAYRVALDHNISDKNMIAEYLEACGVIWAEKKFGLAVPSGMTIQ